ncbi:MAG: hypothetical protein QM396_09620 [Euryarchaeota archaeon]|jgi:hypothetical protein|uniref:hypothetical protein n=1 Tax=Methanobacterium sp. MZD130B TaxID=3394378 RepID=UPI0009C506E4|nr:hypothetical protein [Euryarchaeota archaeon]OPZ93093.1 MAG: hypothetical protein BWY74_01289 [Firmicutes bacterium ADurb.Bin419]HHT18506.1 hypothetical protein [Methanobacterium sp.]
MELRKNFGRYWIAGFVLNLILFAIQIVDGLIFDSMLANQNIILNNNAFLLMFVIFTIIVFIFGFWIYGRIIELLYKKIIQKNN